MERFKSDAEAPVSEEQKRELALIDEKFKAKIAEREIFLNQKLQAALAQGERSEADSLRQQIASEKARLEEEREDAKDKIFIAGADIEALHRLPPEDLERLIAFGQQIFNRLADISIPTVATHIRHLYDKLQVQNAPAAITQAYRTGILPDQREQ